MRLPRRRVLRDGGMAPGAIGSLGRRPAARDGFGRGGGLAVANSDAVHKSTALRIIPAMGRPRTNYLSLPAYSAKGYGEDGTSFRGRPGL